MSRGQVERLGPVCKGFSMNHAQTVFPIAIRKLKKVGMRLPPPRLFEEPLGCRGDKRFFALWWSHSDQAPAMNDGILESVGMPGPYRVWRFHPAVVAALLYFNIGDAAITADHWLLVDRKARALYAGKVWDVLDVLDYQKTGFHESLDNTGSVAGFNGVVRIAGESGNATSRRSEEPMTSDRNLLDELEAWLDANSAGG